MQVLVTSSPVVAMQTVSNQSNSENIEQEVLNETIAQAYDIGPRLFLPALLLSLLLATGIWNHGSHAWVITWFGSLSLCYGLRLLDWRKYHSLSPSQIDAGAWARRLQWSAGFTGLVWGLSVLLPDANEDRVSFFVGFVLAGVCAGAVPSLSCVPRAAMLFVTACILPFAIHSIMDDGMTSILMALMSLLFIVVMLVTVRNNFSNVDKNIRQQLQLMQRDVALTHNEQLRNVALESLRRTQGMLQTFISYAPAAVAMFDRELNYIVHSRHWLSDHGLIETDLAGCNYFDVMPDSAHLMRDAFRLTLSGEVETNDQYPYIRNDGTVRWFRWEMRPWYEDSGAMGGVVMYSEDITETKRANDALQARERLLDKLGVQVPGVMFQGRWRRDANFRFTFVSVNAESLCGISAEQLCKDSNIYLRLFDRTDRDRLRQAAEAAMARAGTIHLQLRIKVPQRGVRWIQINALAERLADASVLWYGYVEDVTLRHEMALDLARYTAQNGESGSDDAHHHAAA